jgi:hypothetical protein
MTGNQVTVHDEPGFAVPFFGIVWKSMVITGLDRTVKTFENKFKLTQFKGF